MLRRLRVRSCGGQNEEEVDDLEENDERGLAELTLLPTRHAQLSEHSGEVVRIVFVVIGSFGFGRISIDAKIFGNKRRVVAS